MLIWSGKGLLAILPIILFPLVMAMGDGLGLSDERASGLAGLIAGIGGALFIYYIDRWLEQRNPPRVLVDQRSGQQVQVRRRDTLFFIPLRFLWVGYAIAAVVGLFFLITG